MTEKEMILKIMQCIIQAPWNGGVDPVWLKLHRLWAHAE